MRNACCDAPRASELTPAAELQSDAGVILPAGVSVPGLVEQMIPAGRYARTVHMGAYDKLPDTWAALMGDWMASSGNSSFGHSWIDG